ncbi:hypothetical protein [Paraburkholderia sediminicola]|uniref:hypothetical protein n=1 Tax=Paraburkholderia sediminicola TaxID=458836 RepID=UPI0038B84E6A
MKSPLLMRASAPLKKRLATRASTDTRGIAAIEIAVLLPIILIMLLGFVELYGYFRASALVTRTAFTLADSLGQQTQLIDNTDASNAANLGAYWNAAIAMANPIALSSSGAVIVTVIDDAGNGKPHLSWQRKSPWSPGATSLLGAGLLPAGYPFKSSDCVVAVEVFYTYKPFALTGTLWRTAPGNLTLYEPAFYRVRFGKELVLVP